MADIELLISQLLLEMAHHPVLLYCGVVGILFASSFGLPLPEEVVLVTSGMIANVALAEAARLGAEPTVEAASLAAVCFAAVFASDLVVFTLGKRFGLPLLRRKPFSRFLTEGALTRVKQWTSRYGAWACCVFRFTPGIRFPGHFICGAMGISYTKFALTDGVAALLTVPTQVLLLAFYGDEILGAIKQFKIWLFAGLGIAFVLWLALRWWRKPAAGGPAGSSEAA